MVRLVLLIDYAAAAHTPRFAAIDALVLDGQEQAIN
jgi:hypothetical protein